MLLGANVFSNLLRQVEEFSLTDIIQSDTQTEPTDGYGKLWRW